MPLQYNSNYRLNILQVRPKYLLYYQKKDRVTAIDKDAKGRKLKLLTESELMGDYSNGPSVLQDVSTIKFAYNKERTYSGNMTKQSQSRIKSKIQLLLLLTNEREIYNTILKRKQVFRLGFLTLTIPFNDFFITAKEANEYLLKPFIRVLRDRYSVNTYIWKAERQKAVDYKGKLKDSLGQLHYHIILPNSIHYASIKREWNKILYYSKYNVNKDNCSLSDYEPNSTDIHSVNTIKDMENYLIKYTSKMPYTHIIEDDELKELPKSEKGNYLIPKSLKQGEKLVSCVTVNNELVVVESSVEGKVWDCSQNLNKACFYEFLIDTKVEIKLHNKNLKENINVTKFEWAELIHVNSKEAIEVMNEEQQKEFELWRKELMHSISLKDSW
jgi:hypothetical protein